MRTFILRARKGSTRWDQIRGDIGNQAHFEVVLHSVINAFFISNGFRQDVEFYIVLDSTPDFPRTIKLSGHAGLSIPGFHEDAVVSLIETILKNSQGIAKNETRAIMPGVELSGFGFEKLVGGLLESRSLYLLDRKGADIRTTTLAADPIFILSDHLAMPKNHVKSFTRQGMQLLSLGPKTLFASQCVVLLNHEMDRNEHLSSLY